MVYSKFLTRHGGLVAGSLVAVVAAAGVAIGVAKAENAPDPQSDLARAIFITTPARFVAPEPAAPAVLNTAPARLVPAIAFAAPVRGYAMNSRFGLRRLSFESAARMHEGVDYAAPKGSPILATASGQVVTAGRSPTYGNFIEVAHGDGISSFYAHMKSATKLKVGDPVLTGDVVGYVGSTGRSTGPHLHFEIRKDGDQFDPALFIGRTFASFDALPFVRSAKYGLTRVAALARGKAHTENRVGVSVGGY